MARIEPPRQSGTWWTGTGEKFDPDSTPPAPAGSYVIHYGGKVLSDSAKDEETTGLGHRPGDVDASREALTLT
jgi:hypothetical protein